MSDTQQCSIYTFVDKSTFKNLSSYSKRKFAWEKVYFLILYLSLKKLIAINLFYIFNWLFVLSVERKKPHLYFVVEYFVSCVLPMHRVTHKGWDFKSENFRIFASERNAKTKRNGCKKKISGKMRNFCKTIFPFRWKP